MRGDFAAHSPAPTYHVVTETSIGLHPPVVASHRLRLMIPLKHTWCARHFVLAALIIAAIPSSSVAQSATSALTLRGLLDSVSASFPAIQAAQQRIRATEASRRSAGAFSNPMASYQVENTRFPGGGSIAGIDRETMAMLTLPLEPLYQRGPRVRQANALVESARADADAVRQGLLRDAAHAFYRVARAQSRVAALEDVGRWLDTLAAYNRARVQEGVTAEADLIRTELERDRALIEASLQLADLARARAELMAFITAAPTQSSTRVVPPGQPFNIELLSVDSASRRSRPELRAARARVDAADASIAVERKMLFREVGATLGAKQMMGTTSMIAGLSVPFPLFDRNAGQVSRAIAERDAERLDLAAATRMADAQFLGAVNAIRILSVQASRLAAPNGGILVRAEQAEQIALGAYREGAVSLLQVLDATRARSEARIAYFDLVFSQHEAVIDLLFASGQDLHASLTRLNTESHP